MPIVLKAGETADPFGNRVKGKDESRVPTLAAEAIQRKRKAEALMKSQTRLADIEP